MAKCPICGGTGDTKNVKPGELTNEGWFCQLPTTEKDAFITLICLKSEKWDADKWLEWLQQKHPDQNSWLKEEN